MRDKDDSELIKCAAAGDGAAFSTLLERHYMTIYRMAFRFCGGKQDAEDVTQLACMKLAQNLHAFKFQSSFTTWLYTLILNTARDWRRSQARHERGAVAIEWAEGQKDDRENAEDQLEIREKFAAVHALPEPEREIIWLVYGEGLSHKEVAKIIGCSEGTISWRIHEARKILKASTVKSPLKPGKEA